jgi:RHS repeat-associated protein
MLRYQPRAYARLWQWLLLGALILGFGGYTHPVGRAANSFVTQQSTVPAEVLKDTIVPTETDVGATEGDFSVSADGTSEYTIPLWVPEGRNGIQPELALHYSSDGSDSLFGVGWGLSGLVEITRCSQTLVDGDLRPVRFKLELWGDELCLNGERLAHAAGFEWAGVGFEYRTARASFDRVVVLEKDDLGPTVFREYKKDGRIFTYGGIPGETTANARIEGKRVIWRASDEDAAEPTAEYVAARYGWALARIEDRSGNTLDITYEQEDQTKDGQAQEIRPSEIRYTGRNGAGATRAVHFRYTERFTESQRDRFVAGFPLKQTRLVEQIDMLAPLATAPTSLSVVRSYRFTYGTASLTGRPLLHSVQECDGDPTATQPSRPVMCKRSTIFAYNEGSDQFEERRTDISDVSGILFASAWTILPGDINGDGRDDIFYRSSSNAGRWTYRLSQIDSDGHVTLSEATTLNIAEQLSRAVSDIVPVDLNVDGRVDLVALLEGDNAYTYYQNVPRQSGFEFEPIEPASTSTVLASAAPTADIEETTRAILITDLAGNARPEIVRPLTSGLWGLREVEVSSDDGDIEAIAPPEPINSVAYDEVPEPTEPPEPPDSSRLAAVDDDPQRAPWNTYTVDIDGDGHPEFLTRKAEVTSTGAVPSGTRFVAFNEKWMGRVYPSNRLDTTLPVSDPDEVTRRYWFADVNGDGMPDALRLTADEPAPSILVNSGGQFGSAQLQDQLTEHENKYNIRIGQWWQYSHDPGIRILDFNLDGRQDILLVDNGAIRDGTINPPAPRDKLAVLVSTNTGLQPRELDIPVGDPTDDVAGVGVYNYDLSRLLDLNGDGLTDLIQVVDGKIRLYVRQGQRPDMLTSVTDGMGLQIAVTYKPLVDPSVYTPGTTCHAFQQCVTRGPWVVSEYRVDNGVGRNQNRYRYRYADARVDVTGLGWLGFGARKVTDVQSNTTLQETFDNDHRSDFGRSGFIYPFLGLTRSVTRTTQLDSGTTRVLTRTLDYEFVAFATSFTLDQSYYARPTAIFEVEREVRADGSGVVLSSVSQMFSYKPDENAFGNLKARETTWHFADGTEQVDRWTAFYRNDPERWLIGLPTRAQLSSHTPDGRTGDRATEFTWDETTGLLDTEIVQPEGGDDEYLETRYEWNEAGQVQLARSTDRQGNSRHTTITYDPIDGVYPFTYQNSLGHVTRLFTDPALGVVGAVDDPDGVRTIRRYDGFGRMRRESLPGGGGIRVTYARGTEPGSDDEDERFTLVVTSTRDGGGELRLIRNRLSQEIRRETKNLDGSFSFVATTWNELGLPDTATRPTRVGLQPEAATRFAYDRLGRLINVERPDETAPGRLVTSQAIYDGREATYIDEVGDTTRVFEDELGRPTRTARVTADGDIVTEFTYGLFDQLETIQRWSVDRSETTLTQIDYDSLARRFRLVDPDAGETRFFYNAFGEVIQETDGNGDQTVYTPDALGRVMTRVDKDGTTTFVWDQRGYGTGKLAETSSPDGVTTAYFYDGFGRPTQQIWTIQGTQYEVAQTYDAHGRPSTLAYPTTLGGRFTIGREYDPDSGELFRVKNATTGATYWELLERATDGQLARERFGNGVDSTRTYFGETGRLKAIVTQPIDKKGAHKLQDLGYDYYANGSLQHRRDALRAQFEGFVYDHLDRLVHWFESDAQGNESPDRWRVVYDYSDLGNLTARNFMPGMKGGATPQNLTFEYDQVNGAGPHAVTRSPWGEYAYDKRGNQIGRPGQQVTYTAFDLPRAIAGPVPTRFQYDAFGTRIVKERSPADKTVYVAGLYERRTNGTQVDHVFYIPGSERTIAQVMRTEVRSKLKSERTLYLHADRLGSVETISDERGKAVENIKLDPYGNRITNFRGPVLPDVGGGKPQSGVTLGFTEHEHDDELGLINMRGRMYDPRLGRFLTPDPIVQAPLNTEAYNRYAYVFNNPLKYHDPSGLDGATVGGCKREYDDYCVETFKCQPGDKACEKENNRIKQCQLGGECHYDPDEITKVEDCFFSCLPEEDNESSTIAVGGEGNYGGDHTPGDANPASNTTAATGSDGQTSMQTSEQSQNRNTRPQLQPAGRIPVQQRIDPGRAKLIPVNRYGETPRRGEWIFYLTSNALDAFRALREAAAAAGFGRETFTLKDAYRSQERQERKAAWAREQYGEKEASKWVAQGRSEHITGQAVDLNLGMTNSSENARSGALENLPQYQWLRENAPNFGFNPYTREPWHWSYNVE